MRFRETSRTPPASGILVLTALLDGDLADHFRSMLQHAAETTGADAGGALLITDPVDGRCVVELLPLLDGPLRSRAELVKECRQICGQRESGEKLFRNSRSVLRARINELGLIQMESARARAFSAAHSQRLAELAETIGIVVSRVLLRQYATGRGFDVAMVGASPSLLEMERQIKVAASDPKSPVMIVGERGSGKELAAFAVHYFGQRRAGPFLPVNSAAFADTLLSDELFGHERYSFTGAQNSRAGILQSADRGTLFFDEIGDMSPPVQASLLRVLDRGELRRIGSDKPLQVDVRIIGATNRDLRKMVQEGTFRADLYDRLNVLRVEVPPLRERKSDIHLLAAHFLKRVCLRNGRHDHVENVGCFSCLAMAGAACARADFYEKLSEYSFPGNVRELQNLITRAASGVATSRLGAEHARRVLSDTPVHAPEATEDEKLETVIRNHIEKVLGKTNNNKSEAARVMGLPLTTLINKMKKVGI